MRPRGRGLDRRSLAEPLELLAGLVPFSRRHHSHRIHLFILHRLVREHAQECGAQSLPSSARRRNGTPEPRPSRTSAFLLRPAAHHPSLSSSRQHSDLPHTAFRPTNSPATSAPSLVQRWRLVGHPLQSPPYPRFASTHPGDPSSPNGRPRPCLPSAVCQLHLQPRRCGTSAPADPSLRIVPFFGTLRYLRPTII